MSSKLNVIEQQTYQRLVQKWMNHERLCEYYHEWTDDLIECARCLASSGAVDWCLIDLEIWDKQTKNRKLMIISSAFDRHYKDGEIIRLQYEIVELKNKTQKKKTKIISK